MVSCGTGTALLPTSLRPPLPAPTLNVTGTPAAPLRPSLTHTLMDWGSVESACATWSLPVPTAIWVAAAGVADALK